MVVFLIFYLKNGYRIYRFLFFIVRFYILLILKGVVYIEDRCRGWEDVWVFIFLKVNRVE